MSSSKMTKVMLVILSAVVFASCGKAKIESNCVMNGMGSGTCHFTNTGDGKGSICGRIVVVKYETGEKVQSGLFCSGILPKNTTNSVQFSVPEVSDFCESGTYTISWTSVCYFNFVEADKKGKE